MPHQNETRLRTQGGGATRLFRLKSFGDDTAFLAQKNTVTQAQTRLRRQRLVEHLHNLGPAPLGHFIRDLVQGSGE